MLSLYFAIAANADDRKPGDKPFDDAKFVAEAGRGGISEVELGKLAVAQAMH